MARTWLPADPGLQHLDLRVIGVNDFRIKDQMLHPHHNVQQQAQL